MKPFVIALLSLALAGCATQFGTRVERPQSHVIAHKAHHKAQPAASLIVIPDPEPIPAPLPPAPAPVSPPIPVERTFLGIPFLH